MVHLLSYESLKIIPTCSILFKFVYGFSSVPVTNLKGKPLENKSNQERNRKLPKTKGNFVQTHGVFSDGLSKAEPKANNKNVSSAPTIEKPKLNLKRNVSKLNEDAKIKELLKDDFIDDASMHPNLDDPPMTLPLFRNRKYFYLPRAY